MSQKILTNLQKGLFTITLNYPEKHNCIGFEMLEAMERAIEEARTDHRVRTILIKGAGEKAFSSGADLTEFDALTGSQIKRWIVLGHTINNGLERLGKPTIAYINGYAMGGGLELAMACDFRLASVSAVLSAPEVSNGWLPGWGGMARARRLIGEAHAKRLVLLSERIDAREALRIGLVTEVLEEGNETQRLDTFAQKLTTLRPDVFSMAKSILMDPGRTTTGTAIDFDVLAVQIAKES